MTDPKDSDEIFKGPALGADGRLEERLSRLEPPRGPEAFAPVEEKLELDVKSRRAIEARVETFREEAGARSRRPWALKLFLAVMLLGVAGFGALLYFKPKLDVPILDGVRQSSLLDELTAPGEPQPIIVSSTPTGATIFIGGKNLGQTPWAGENRWSGETPLRLELAGYRTWEGTMKGGKPQTFDITLKK